MTQTLELLDHQKDTLESIRGIVRTMKTLSAINALPYEQAAHAIDACHDTVLLGLQAFMHVQGPLALATSGKALPVLIVLGSDHGLCGNYNELLAAEAVRHAILGKRTPIICVGARMADALRSFGLVPEPALLPPATVDGLGRVAAELINRLDAIERASTPANIDVTLVYMRRSSRGLQAPEARHLLPLDHDLVDDLVRAPWQSRQRPQFRAPAAELLAALLRSFLFTSLFRAAAESLVTENAARLARMQQAERSVDERLDTLSTEQRSVRQSEITTELLDVVIGFETLRKRRTRKNKSDTLLQ